MSLFEGLGDELVDSPPLVDDKQNEPVRQTVLGEPPKASPFAGLGDELESPDPLRPTLGEATKNNPDTYAKAARIAREQGVPAQIVMPSLEEFERHMQLQKLNTERLGKEFAVTAGFLRNYDNASQLHDDVDTLTKLETWFKDKQSYLGGRFERGEAVVELGTLQAREVYERLGIPRSAPQTDEERARIEYLTNLLKVSESADEQGQFFKMLGAAAEQLPILGGMMDAGARPLAEGLAVGTAAGAVAGTVAAAPTVLGTPVGTLTGAATGGMLGMRTMIPVAKAATVKKILDTEVGNAYNEFIRETDEAGNVMDPQVAAYAAGAYGVIAAGLESLSLKALGKVFSGPKDAFNRTIKNKIKQVLKDKTARQKLTELGKNWAGLIATESITEALQEGAQVVFGELAKVADTESFTEQDLSKALDNIFSLETADKMVHAATEAARATVVIGAAGTATTIAVDGVRSETRAAGEQRKIDELTEIMQNSKGAQRNPDLVREFLQQASTEGDSVYMPAQPIFEYLVENDIDPYTDPVFQGIARQIDEAAGLGGDVVVPLADFATSIAVSDHMEALRPHMRLSADTAAPSEVKAFQEAQQNWVNKLVEEAEAEATVFEEAQSVYEEVREKLVGTGRATEAVAKLQAQVIPAYVTRLAVATGRGVRELFDEMALQLSGPFSEQQAAQAQRATDLGVVLEQPVIDRQKADDLIAEIGHMAQVSDDGMVTVYHRTTLEAAAKIRETGRMVAKEDGLFFSTKRDGQATGYGDEVVELRIPADMLELDDIFDDEAHLRLPAKLGKPSDVSGFLDQDGVEYRQGQIVTETENFKRWFGESKVVDESGAPLVVYHGGGEKIIDFSNGPARGFLGVAYFTGDKKVAWKYALGGGIDQRKNLAEYRRRQLAQLPSRQPNVTRVYLRMENPFYGDSSRAWGEIRKTFSIEEILAAASGNWTGDRISELADENEISKAEVLEDYWDDLAGDLGGGTFLEHDNDSLAESPAIKFLEFTGLASEFHKRNGYDGYVFEDAESGGKTYVPFSPTQIKSVFNKGTFDPSDPNILNQSQPNGPAPRGYYDSTANMIRLLEASDLSTFLHESAHFFLEMEKRFNPQGVAAVNAWFSRNAADIALEANKYLGQSGAVEQSAFHGSPHTFDEFKLQHIGTGEGAQAYGWGLYFAGSKEVAEYYREALSGAGRKLLDASFSQDPELWVAGQLFSNISEADILSGLEILEYDGDAQALIVSGKDRLAKEKKAAGRLYHVELAPTDDQWLLWDKPLSEQSETVRAALESGVKRIQTDAREQFKANTEDAVAAERLVRMRQIMERQDAKGNDIYFNLASSGNLGSHEAASRFLNSIGIPGIKYLDGSSRGKGDGNFNYVLFDDSLVKITRFEQSQQTPTGAPGVITEQHVQQWLADGATGDARVDEAIKRATHEQFARGFETYLMEGKAPSLELREAFRAFARWLTDLYRKIKGDLNVKLDDQMRAVFDRLLATEDQIAAVEAANRYRPLFTDAAMAGMTEEEFADYRKKQEAPTAKAKETLQEKIFAQLKRETEGWWQEEKAERVKTIVEQLRNQPVYNATETLREKGGEIKLDRAAVKEMLGVDRVPDQLRGMTLTGMQGVSLDDAAAFFGYKSGHQMVSEIMAARPIRQVAAEQAEAEMKAEHGDILNDGTLEREAQDAAHNEERGKQILVELKALARAQNRPAIDRAAIKALAEENIGRLPLTRILPHKYRRAEIRAAQAAQSAMDKGDRGAALQAKMQQAMNFYLWRAATDARTRADKIVRFTRKYKKTSIRQQIAKAGNGYLEQIDGILERFAFDTSVKKVALERQDIAEWAAERAEAGDNLQLTREVLSEQMRKHYKEIPFDVLLGVYDSIRNIDHIARFANKVKKDGELLDFLEVKREVLAHLDNLPVKFKTLTSVTRRQTTGKKALWHIAQMTKLPVLFTWLDGGKRAGLMHKLLGQPFTDAAQARQRLYREVGLPIVAAIRERSKADQKRHNQKVYIPEAVSEVNDGTFMRHELISVALNTGNLSNLEKMLKGEGWVAADAAMEEISVDNPKLQAILSHLTDSDWTLVETIWQQIDQLFPLMAEVHKRTSGLELPKIAATGFTLPSGRKIAGGYYPVKYDPERGDRAEQNEAKQQAMLDSLFGPGGMLKPSATTGAKIERTDYFAPIRFSLDVVPNHIDEVIQYITHYEAVQQVYKLTNDSEIKKAIKERVGTAEYNQIRPWLNDIAKDGRETPPKQLWDPLLRRLRFGTTLGMMGFKASTGLMQISGLSNSVAEVGLPNMLRALRHVSGALFSPRSGSATEMWQFVTERSKIMADRINTMDRELMNAMSAIRDKSGILKAAQETGMKHIAYIQTYTVDLPTWYGAYYKGLEEAKAQLDAEDFDSFKAYSEALEAQAVRRADWTVENVQGSGMTKDMAQIMRNQTETGRMLTMFFTFFSSLWNMQRDAVRGARSGQYGITSLAAKLLFLYAIPVAYEMAIRGELEDDDDKTAMEKYLTRLAIYPTATVPIVRDVVNAAVSGFDFQMTPVASIIEKGIKGSTKLSEGALSDEEISLAQAKNAAKLAGALFGLPGVSQAFSTGEHLYDVIEEGEELTARELLFGPRRD